MTINEESTPSLLTNLDSIFLRKILHITCFNHTPSTYANLIAILTNTTDTHKSYPEIRHSNITGYPFVLHIVKVLPQRRHFVLLFINYSHKVTVTGPQMRTILYDLSVISFIVLAFYHAKAFHPHKTIPNCRIGFSRRFQGAKILGPNQFSVGVFLKTKLVVKMSVRGVNIFTSLTNTS